MAVPHMPGKQPEMEELVEEGVGGYNGKLVGMAEVFGGRWLEEVWWGRRKASANALGWHCT